MNYLNNKAAWSDVKYSLHRLLCIMISLMSSSYKLLKNIVYFLAFNSCLYNPFTSLVSFVITYNQKHSNKIIVFFAENKSTFSIRVHDPPRYLNECLIYVICCLIHTVLPNPILLYIAIFLQFHFSYCKRWCIFHRCRTPLKTCLLYIWRIRKCVCECCPYQVFNKCHKDS
jgi:hypothetical protein